MNYLPWAVLALAAYSLVAPLMRLATSGPDAVPSDVGALVANTVLVVASVGLIAATDESVARYATEPKMAYVLAAGVCLSVGILSYYRALSLGPVSVVSPVFALFFVASSLVGVVALDEAMTARKLVGIGLAAVAVVLVAGE